VSEQQVPGGHDGLDNDCDGAVDEDLGSTTCGVGERERTVDNRVNGEELRCTKQPKPRVRGSGLDNDCDGAVGMRDLGLDNPGSGECESTVENCVYFWRRGGGVPPEVCDGPITTAMVLSTRTRPTTQVLAR
jgi:hypothetical protein